MLTSILVYTLTILFTPLMMLWYREFARFILVVILSVLVLGLPIAIILGLVTVRGHRKQNGRETEKVQNLAAA